MVAGLLLAICHGDSVNRDSSTVIQLAQACTIGKSMDSYIKMKQEKVEEKTRLYTWRQGLTEPLTRIRNSSVTVPLHNWSILSCPKF